jgi:predicted ATPase/class 3 adenylate cyclase
MRQLPTGTVTFLFTDIERSTRLLHELGDRYSDVLAEHRGAIRKAVTLHGGVEVDTQGDAFFVAFPRATDAAAAAAAAQDALADGVVRVRMGLHTGEPTVTEEGYVGIAVHQAARIMGAGHGGQVLLSQTTRDLLDPGFELRDLGEHRLKDLSAPQRLYQLGDGDFPPLKTLHQTNLPIQATPLIGRERELEELAEGLGEHRLVTLVGPGGTGKTRLALQAAADAVESFEQGVWWVPLAPVTDPERVEGAIATAVGADGPLLEHLKPMQALLLIDNFEQVVAGASQVAALLEGAPRIRVLVTSREPLRVHAECRYAVDPLPETDAVALFVERARAVDAGFTVGEAVPAICRRLDGLPLAVELAAARVGLLSPPELLARLDRALPLLTAGTRDAPERQQTLRATIEWSFDLLADEERRLFAELAVFAGSFTLAAAEQVCRASLDSLQSLVDKNLVRRWGSGRFGMLETIREYALEKLDELDDAESVRRRHAEFFLEVAESANLSAALKEPGEQRLDLAMLEQENMRSALGWTFDRGEIAVGLRLAGALEQFWVVNDPREGMRWFSSLLDHPGVEAAAPDVRGHALRSYGSSAHIAGHPEQAEELWEQSLSLFEQLGDDHGRAVLLHRLAISAMIRGDLERARELVDESHEIHTRRGDLWGQAQTVGTLGAISRDEGNEADACELLARSGEMARQVGVPWWYGGTLGELAAVALKAGRLEEAESRARELLALAAELRDRPSRVFAVGLLAGVAAARGECARAGRLWGAIEDEVAAAPLGGWQRHRAQCAEHIEALASLDFERARAVGRVWTLDEAVEYALSGD